MIFSDFGKEKLIDQAEKDQPFFTQNYSNLARIAKTELAANRPSGSILDNPLTRYVELRRAMEFLREPSERKSHCLQLWRITWYEMIAEAIPDDEMELFCSLLFASSLLSVVRYWYTVDALKNEFPPYWDQWTEETQGSSLFQGDYAEAQDCDARFSSHMESSIRPVWGILSSVDRVISPHSLPTWILDIHLTGKGRQPDYRFWSDRYAELFQKGADILLSESRNDLGHGDSATISKIATLRRLFTLEASRRYGLNF